ncbi:hypothetical protein GCM10027589_42120 [Actinocorallia lasiicapitis]
MRRHLPRLANLWWETRLGVSTRGTAATGYPDAVHYATMSYATIGKVLDGLELGPDDELADLGSGLGRVLCCAARRPIRAAVGYEVDPGLCGQARRNAVRLRGRKAPITVHEGPAQEMTFRDVTAFFLFDPFGEQTLRAVLDKIEADTGGVGVRFAYANPSHDHVFAERKWLEAHDFWDAAEKGLEHSVAFYRSHVASA